MTLEELVITLKTFVAWIEGHPREIPSTPDDDAALLAYALQRLRDISGT